MAGYLATSRREKKTCSVAEARYVPETSFRRNNASKYALNAAPGHNKHILLCKYMAYRSQTGRQSRHTATERTFGTGIPGGDEGDEGGPSGCLGGGERLLDPAAHPPPHGCYVWTHDLLLYYWCGYICVLAAWRLAPFGTSRWEESGSDLLTNEGGWLKKRKRRHTADDDGRHKDRREHSQ